MSHLKLNAEYYNFKSPSSLSGIAKLKAAFPKIPRKDLKLFLEAQDVYTKHKFTKTKFQRRKVMSIRKNYLWQADLVDVQKFSRFNKGVKFLLTVIDVLTRYAYVVCLKNKTASEVTTAFSTIISDKNKPKYLESDLGKEFVNKQFKDFLNTNNITHYHNYSNFGACLVERFNQTLQSKISKYFTYTGSKNYITILPQLVDSYNNSKHSATKFTPSSITKYNEMDAWMNSYEDLFNTKWKTKPDYKLNDIVRVKKPKSTFEKGYTSRFSDELFLIQEIVHGHPIMYRIKDFHNVPLNGLFYSQELSKVNTE